MNPKAKGANAERELAALLSGWALEINITLEPLRNLEQTRGGGYDLNGVPGLAVECKRCETLDISGWWRQCKSQATEGLIPLLAYRQSRRRWQFMTEAWVWPCRTQPLVVHMDEPEAKLWFQAHLQSVTQS